jgi:GUN4-like
MMMFKHNFSWLRNRKFRSLAIILVALSANSCQLKSDKTRDINYNPLVKQLKAENWRSADTETLQLILNLSDRTAEGWLNKTDVEKLDCTTLVKIDRLWIEQSKGQFGFSQQRLIWLSAGGTVGQYDPKIAEKFGDRVGWRDRGKWRAYNTLKFSIYAPKGHLPATTGNGVSGSVWGGVAAISKRLQSCRHEELAIARQEYYAKCSDNSRDRRCLLKKAAERWGETPDWGGQGIAKLLDELERELSQRQWIKADKITRILLDRYRQANLAEFRDSDSMELIPCYLLKPVDDLWMEYSQGRFGLTAQRDVLSEHKLFLQQNLNYDYLTATKARTVLGWNQLPNVEPDTHHRIHRPYSPAFNAIDPQRVPKGFYPYDMGYSYYTYGSAYNGEWRFYLNPACGFNP